MADYDLTQWHDVDSYGETFRERFDPEAAKGLDTKGVFRFKVIRETWNTNVEPPERIIHEIEAV